LNSFLSKPTTALQGTLSGTEQTTHAVMGQMHYYKDKYVMQATDGQMVISQIQYRFLYRQRITETFFYCFKLTKVPRTLATMELLKHFQVNGRIAAKILLALKHDNNHASTLTSSYTIQFRNSKFSVDCFRGA
jgi:hypothetical protein